MQLDQLRLRPRCDAMCSATPKAAALMHLVKVCDQRIDGRVEGELPATTTRVFGQLIESLPIS